MTFADHFNQLIDNHQKEQDSMTDAYLVQTVTEEELAQAEDILDRIAEAGQLFQPAVNHTLNGLARECYGVAASKGFHDEDRGVIEEIALIHSEASEWLEEVRDGHGPEEHYYRNPEDKTETRGTFQIFPDVGKLWKPEGQAAEAADIIIRVMDACGNPKRRIDIARAVFEKLQYNKTRGHKHGKTC